jgi:hypothetical protein
MNERRSRCTEFFETFAKCIGVKWEKRELDQRDVPLGCRSLTAAEISELKADDRISVLGEQGIESRVFLCAKEGFVWTRKPNSSAVFFQTLPTNIVTTDRSTIHELTDYDN